MQSPIEELNGTELIHLLADKGRSEDERFDTMSLALHWVTQELRRLRMSQRGFVSGSFKSFKDMKDGTRCLPDKHSARYKSRKYLKQQDKSLMKQFNHIREQMNNIRDMETCAARGRSLSTISETEPDRISTAKRLSMYLGVGEENFRRRAFSDIQH